MSVQIDKKCPKCGEFKVIKMRWGYPQVRIVCQNCGWSEIIDDIKFHEQNNNT